MILGRRSFPFWDGKFQWLCVKVPGSVNRFMKKWNTGSSFGSSKTLQTLLKPQKEWIMQRTLWRVIMNAQDCFPDGRGGFDIHPFTSPHLLESRHQFRVHLLWDHSPFGRINGHNSFNSFNAFMNEKRKLQPTFNQRFYVKVSTRQIWHPFHHLYEISRGEISMSNLPVSNQDVQWQKFLKKKPSRFDARRHVWCLAPGEAG